MTTKVKSDGNVIHITAPTGGYSSGQLVELTDIVAVVYDTAAAGTTAVGMVEGVFTLTKTAHAAGGFSQGDSVYLTTSGVINNTSSGDQFVGIAWEAATTTATTVDVRLNWGG